MPGLFNKKILNQRIKNYTVENIEEKIAKIKNWQENLSRIKGLNEVELQNAFLGAVFEDILGYEDAPQKEEWTLKIEPTTDVDSKRPDAILGFYSWDNGQQKSHRAVIELKGPQVPLEKDQKRENTTYKSPVDQGFSYTNKLDKCRWVIVSNFTEIRLYQVGRSKEYYEVFLFDDLDDREEFKKFHYLLHKNNLISRDGKSQTFQLTEATQKRHEEISVEFYNLYKNTRINLFEHLKEHNEDIDLEVLLEKAQKFLDRIIFICFCEDKGLIPNDLLHQAIKSGTEGFNPSETPVWDEIRGVFRAIDNGNPNHNINAFDGGLFEYDDVLDNLTIKNEFFEAIYDISDYDFDSDVDVNILGHIFEQSIGDIEKLKSNIREDDYDESESKRKKEGIYYTPQYITSYIVENAVGGYLEDIKEELGYYDLPDIEEAGSDSWETRYTNQHLEFYEKYEEKLKNIKILDPACGSGAFLNQAFDYLLNEHQWLNKQRDLLKGGQSSIFAVEALQRTILKNNLFGVDLNEESVEITKLSLWLKTANKNKPLTNLDDNIKCGNSLIDDQEIVGDKAFKWEEEFSAIIDEGGFDVVIGNPPYNAELEEIERIFLSDQYSDISNLNTANLFIYKSNDIIHEKSYCGLIVPKSLSYSNSWDKTRMFLKDKLTIAYDASEAFEDVLLEQIIIIFNISNQKKQVMTGKIFPKGFISEERMDKNLINKFDCLLTGIPLIEIDIGKKLFNYQKRFDDFCSIKRGKDIQKYLVDSNWDIPIYRCKSIGRYKLSSPKEGLKRKDYNVLKEKIKYMEQPKIVIQNIIAHVQNPVDHIILMSTVDNKGIIGLGSVGNIFIEKNKSRYWNYFIVGLLNSRLMSWYAYRFVYGKAIRTMRFDGIHLQQLPFPEEYNDNSIKQVAKLANNIIKNKEKLNSLNKISFLNIASKYTSKIGNPLTNIIKKSNFSNKIYSGRARKVRNFTVNINTNIITIYADKSGSGKYELLKFEEDDQYKRQYLKYYLENLTEEQLKEIDGYSGNILKKVLQIEIPDYDKDQVVRKVVNEWENLQQEIADLEDEIEKTDNEIDQMVYDLYDLTDEEIEIVEKNLNKGGMIK